MLIIARNNAGFKKPNKANKPIINPMLISKAARSKPYLTSFDSVIWVLDFDFHELVSEIKLQTADWPEEEQRMLFLYLGSE